MSSHRPIFASGPWPLCARAKGGGSSQAEAFEFSFQKRSDRRDKTETIRQLGVSILNICSVVPDGVVVFFPSYGYLDEVVKAWQLVDSRDNPASIWDRLQMKKAVFRESKGGSSEDVLQEYSAAILEGGEGTAANSGGQSQHQQRPQNKRGGALLLSVVGGKMSEGINFSDRLGRCVVIVGLPYPNINSPEWKARIEYIESSTRSRLLTDAGLSPDSPASKPAPKEAEAVAAATIASKQAAREFYENACMRAVNQSIGRAIRHQQDYAAIVLVDRRFGTERIRAKLPGWIRGGMVHGSEEKGLQGLMGTLNGFFRGKKGGVAA